MKRLLRIISVALVVFTLFSCTVSAFAASPVSSVNCQYTGSASKGDNKVFYVKANGTTCKLKFTCGKGVLIFDGLVCSNYVYGAYEVKITDVSTGAMVLDKDVWCTSSATLKFTATKGHTYMVKVWNWNPETIGNSYANNGKLTGKDSGETIAYWALNTSKTSWYSFPTCTAKNASNCTLYLTKP